MESCADFRIGRCTRGDSCKFSHDGPVSLQTPASDERCADFRIGRCTRGNDCKFVHEVAANVTDSQTTASAERCADYRMGRCTRGNGCKFLHEGAANLTAAALGLGVSKELCGDYKTGKCTRGASCKFSHDLVGAGAALPRTTFLTQPPAPQITQHAPTLQGPYRHPVSGRYYFYNPSTGQSEWAPEGMVAPGAFSPPSYSLPTTSAFVARTPAPVADTRELCGDYKNGRCTRGAGCKFSHGGVDLSRRALATPIYTPPQQPIMAMAYVPPQLPTYAASVPVDTREACGDFKLGKCMRGAGCKFSHGVQVAAEACGDFKLGKCTRGSSCKFSHSVQGGLEECADFKRGQCTRGDACKFFHARRVECGDFKKGLCTRDNCKYAHTEGSERRARSRSPY